MTVAQPVEREVVEWDEYTGRTEAVKMVEVRARVNGYLQSVHFKDGTEVKQGDLLFVIDPRPYQAELDRAAAELNRAETRLELAINELQRADRLMKSKAISEEEADSRSKAKREADAALRAAQAAVAMMKLNVEYTRITAPISGRIGRKLIRLSGRRSEHRGISRRETGTGSRGLARRPRRTEAGGMDHR